MEKLRENAIRFYHAFLRILLSIDSCNVDRWNDPEAVLEFQLGKDIPYYTKEAFLSGFDAGLLYAKNNCQCEGKCDG